MKHDKIYAICMKIFTLNPNPVLTPTHHHTATLNTKSNYNNYQK